MIEGQKEDESQLAARGGCCAEIDSKINGLLFQGLLEEFKDCMEDKIDSYFFFDCSLRDIEESLHHFS